MKRASGQLKSRYGRHALVTGASSGIGYAFAERICQEGLHCTLVSENEVALVRSVQTLRRKFPMVEVRSITCDLSREEEVGQLVSRIDAMDINVLVNCAGYGMMGYFIQHPWADYARMIQVNELAALRLTHAFCRKLYMAGAVGAVINVSTANAQLLRGCPFSAVYSAGKSMLQNLTEAVAFEMGPHGLDILNVSPGPTDTMFQDVAGTHRLWWVETPANVAERALRALGRRSSVTTNPIMRALVVLHNLLPIPARLKTACRAYGFRVVLGRKENSRLPAREDREQVPAELLSA